MVMPGAVATSITENSGVEVPNMGGDAEEGDYKTTSAEDAAQIILDGIESDDLHIYVGKDSHMMNLAVRIAPRKATHMISKKMKDLLG